MERSRFEAKWEPERPLYTTAKNRSTNSRKRERKGGEREDTPWQSQKHVTSVSTNRVRAESRVYVMKHTTKNKSWAGERAAAAVSER